MSALSGWLTILNLLIVVGGSIGGFIAIKTSLAKAESDVQQRVREALEVENNLLKDRIDRLEKTNRRMEKIVQLISITLERTHHIKLTIDEDIVSLKDIKSGNSHNVSIDDTLNIGA